MGGWQDLQGFKNLVGQIHETEKKLRLIGKDRNLQGQEDLAG